MVVLGFVESDGGNNLRHDGAAELSCFFAFLPGSSRGLLLLRRMEKNCRAVLRAEIRALPVQLRGIVVLPENVQQVFIRDFGGIVLDFNRFGVTGPIAANVFIGWILRVSAGIAHACSTDAGNLAERGFNTPETSCRKRCFGHISSL